MLDDIGEAEKILCEVNFPVRQRIFLDLNRLADYYAIPGMAVRNLKLFPIYSRPGFYWDFWNTPVYFLDQEERTSWDEECLQLERRYFANLYDSPHYLELGLVEYLLTLFRLTELNPDICSRALKMYVEVNHDRLIGERNIIDGAIFATGAYNPQFILVRDTLEEISKLFNHFYPILDDVVKVMHSLSSKDCHLLDVSKAYKPRNPWLLWNLQVHGEYFQYSQFSFPICTSFRLLSGRKLLLFDLHSILMIRDLDTGIMTQLGLPITDGLCVLISWHGKLLAVDSDNIWELEIADYSWLELKVNHLGFRFSGRPSVVGDRLYFFPLEEQGDWIGYIEKSADQNHADYEYESFFIEPTEENLEVRDLLEGPFLIEFMGYYPPPSGDGPDKSHSELICPADGEDSRAFLFTRSEVLVVDRDNLTVLERRSWPELPRADEFLKADFSAHDLHILYIDLLIELEDVYRKVSLFKLDFPSWTFVEVLVDKFNCSIPDQVGKFMIPLNTSASFGMGINMDIVSTNLIIRHNDDRSAFFFMTNQRRLGNITTLGDEYNFSVIPTSYTGDPLISFMVHRNLVICDTDNRMTEFWNVDDGDWLKGLANPTQNSEFIWFAWNEDLLLLSPNTTQLWVYNPKEHCWSGRDIDKVSSFQNVLTTRDRIYLVPVGRSEIGDCIEYLAKDEKDSFKLRKLTISETNKLLISLISRQLSDVTSLKRLNQSVWGPSPSTSSDELIYSGFICPLEDRPFAFLFYEYQILLINTDSLEIMGTRGLPTLPRPDHGHFIGQFSNRCFVVYYADPDEGGAFEVYNFDFTTWEFVRVITGNKGPTTADEENGPEMMESSSLSTDCFDAMYS